MGTKTKSKATTVGEKIHEERLAERRRSMLQSEQQRTESKTDDEGRCAGNGCGITSIVRETVQSINKTIVDQLNDDGYVSQPRQKVSLHSTRLYQEVDAFLAQDGEEDENQPMSREALLEKIRQKKEVIEKLRCQPWSMRRKRKTLKLAQRHLEKHESKVSRSHLYKEEVARRWKKFKRWVGNVSIYLIPWEAKIKRIESHYGSVVSSYFIFLRWIFWVNFMITIIVSFFIVVPEVLADLSADAGRMERTESRKQMTPIEERNSDYIQTIWDFKGRLRVTPLFYGYYSSDEYMGENIRYQIPLAYFLVNLFILGYSFFAILRKMASNARQSKLASGKTEQYVFCWKLFTGWDYTIGNQETAGNTVMANANKLREAIAEYRVKLRQKFVCLRFMFRILANLIILLMIAGSTYVIFSVVRRSSEDLTDASAFRQNEVPIVVSFITLVFPNLFEVVGKMERYHPRTCLRLQLGRILILYVLNYYTLIFALFNKMNIYQEKAEHFTNINNTTLIALDGDNYYGGRFVRQLVKGGPPPLTIGGTPASAFYPNFTTKADDLRMLTAFSEKIRSLPPDYFREESKDSRILNTVIEPSGLKYSENKFVNAPNKINLLQRLISLLRRPEQRVEFDGQPLDDTGGGGGGGGSGRRVPLQDQNDDEDEDNNATSSTRRLNIQFTLPNSSDNFSMSIEARLESNRTNDAVAGSGNNDNVDPAKLSPGRSTNFAGSSPSRGLLTSDDFRNMCWETMVGQPEYGEFKVAENVLHIINNQGMIWLGLFFAPLLPALNNIKLVILLYIRAWAVMTCNIPATQIFRASRSSNFYLVLLLLMLFLCTLPVGYVIASRIPSKACGPFSGRTKFYNIVTDKIKKSLPDNMVRNLNHVASPGVVIPIFVLLILIIYFLVSLIRGMKEANTDLQQQLTHERTEEKRKIYLLAGGGKHKESTDTHGGPSMPETPKVDLSHLPEEEKKRRDPWRKRIPLTDLSNVEEGDEESGSLPTIILNKGQPIAAGDKRLELPPSPELKKSPSPIRKETTSGFGKMKLIRNPLWKDHDKSIQWDSSEVTDQAETTEGEDGDRRSLLKPNRRPPKVAGKDSVIIDIHTETTELDPSSTDPTTTTNDEFSDHYHFGGQKKDKSSMKQSAPSLSQPASSKADRKETLLNDPVVDTPPGVRNYISQNEPRLPFGAAQIPSCSNSAYATAENSPRSPPSTGTDPSNPISHRSKYENDSPRDPGGGGPNPQAKKENDKSIGKKPSFKISPRELESLISPLYNQPPDKPWENELNKIRAERERSPDPRDRVEALRNIPPIHIRKMTPEMVLRQLTSSPMAHRRKIKTPSPKQPKNKSMLVNDGKNQTLAPVEQSGPESGTESDMERFARSRLSSADPSSNSRQKSPYPEYKTRLTPFEQEGRETSDNSEQSPISLGINSPLSNAAQILGQGDIVSSLAVEKEPGGRLFPQRGGSKPGGVYPWSPNRDPNQSLSMHQQQHHRILTPSPASTSSVPSVNNNLRPPSSSSARSPIFTHLTPPATSLLLPHPLTAGTPLLHPPSHQVMESPNERLAASEPPEHEHNQSPEYDDQSTTNSTTTEATGSFMRSLEASVIDTSKKGDGGDGENEGGAMDESWSIPTTASSLPQSSAQSPSHSQSQQQQQSEQQQQQQQQPAAYEPPDPAYRHDNQPKYPKQFAQPDEQEEDAATVKQQQQNAGRSSPQVTSSAPAEVSKTKRLKISVSPSPSRLLVDSSSDNNNGSSRRNSSGSGGGRRPMLIKQSSKSDCSESSESKGAPRMSTSSQV